MHAHPLSAKPRQSLRTSIKGQFEDFDKFWRCMPTKWLQERGNGSKNEVGITLEGPCVGDTEKAQGCNVTQKYHKRAEISEIERDTLKSENLVAHHVTCEPWTCVELWTVIWRAFL